MRPPRDADPTYWRILNATSPDSAIDAEAHALEIYRTVIRAQAHTRGPRRRKKAAA